MTTTPGRSGGLEITGLRVAVAGREILRGIDLRVGAGEVHAVMGPNGAGKSTLSQAIMGKPGYDVLAGTVTLDGVDLLALQPWERARAGLFLAMQYPTEVAGVRVIDLLAESFRASGRDPRLAAAAVGTEARAIGLDERLLERSLNVDLSGTSPAARRSATRRCSSPCSVPASPSSMRSTPASTSMPCGRCPVASSPPPRSSTSACSPSPTTTVCSTS
jgi:ABC-type transporter Mla maintaining outer membrane lipid asymmetry ATPase subunit MlaF